MNKRDNELRDIAVGLYTNKDNPHTYDNEKCMAFIDGVKWVEKNPSDEMILRAVVLYADATLMWSKLKMDYSKKWANSDEFKLDYIKSHWND